MGKLDSDQPVLPPSSIQDVEVLSTRERPLTRAVVSTVAVRSLVAAGVRQTDPKIW